MNIKNTLKQITKKISRTPIVLEAIGFCAYAYTYIVGKTGHFEVYGMKEFEQLITKNDGAIFVTWHGRALLLPYFWSNIRQMKALVSPHHDGRIIAGLLRRFHILSIDGSSDRKAHSAALEIVKELNQGTVVALIPDGPRGPSMNLNKSVIYFAQKTGKPIMGFTYSARNSKIATRSWDSMLIPKPFCQGKVAGTKPLFVPQNATEEELENLRQQFEKELNDLTFKLDKEYSLPAIIPGAQKRKNKR